MEKILLLGGSAQQIVAIETAKKLGYYTVLCDFLSDNPGQYHADKFYLESTTDKEKILEIAKEEKINGPFSTIEPIGICEEKDLNVILVPVVGFFDTYRLGYGKGYYDRYLKDSSALKIGIAFDVQEIKFDVKPTDIKLDMIITESRILR